MNFEELTPEQKEKVRSCKTADELIALAEAEGVELSDAELDSIAGGKEWYEWTPCDADSFGCPRND